MKTSEQVKTLEEIAEIVRQLLSEGFSDRDQYSYGCSMSAATSDELWQLLKRVPR